MLASKCLPCLLNGSKREFFSTAASSARFSDSVSQSRLGRVCLSMLEWCSRRRTGVIRGRCRQILCCADRQSTGNRRSTQEVPKNVSLGVVVQKPGLGAADLQEASSSRRSPKVPAMPTEPPPQKAPDRRGGGAWHVGSARARAERGWGQGAGSWRPPPSEHAPRAA